MDAYSSSRQMMDELLRSRTMLGTDAYSSSMHMMDDLLRGRNARSLLMGAESMRLMDEAISLQLNRPNLFYPSLREMDMLRATDSFAARFRLPAKTEVARLMVEFAEIHSETLARCAPPEGGLKQGNRRHADTVA